MGVKRKSRKGRKFHYPSITDNLPKFNDGGKLPLRASNTEEEVLPTASIPEVDVNANKYSGWGNLSTGEKDIVKEGNKNNPLYHAAFAKANNKRTYDPDEAGRALVDLGKEIGEEATGIAAAKHFKKHGVVNTLKGAGNFAWEGSKAILKGIGSPYTGSQPIAEMNTKEGDSEDFFRTLEALPVAGALGKGVSKGSKAIGKGTFALDNLDDVGRQAFGKTNNKVTSSVDDINKGFKSEIDKGLFYDSNDLEKLRNTDTKDLNFFDRLEYNLKSKDLKNKLSTKHDKEAQRLIDTPSYVEVEESLKDFKTRVATTLLSENDKVFIFKKMQEHPSYFKYLKQQGKLDGALKSKDDVLKYLNDEKLIEDFYNKYTKSFRGVTTDNTDNLSDMFKIGGDGQHGEGNYSSNSLDLLKEFSTPIDDMKGYMAFIKLNLPHEKQLKGIDKLNLIRDNMYHVIQSEGSFVKKIPNNKIGLDISYRGNGLAERFIKKDFLDKNPNTFDILNIKENKGDLIRNEIYKVSENSFPYLKTKEKWVSEITENFEGVVRDLDKFLPTDLSKKYQKKITELNNKKVELQKIEKKSFKNIRDINEIERKLNDIRFDFHNDIINILKISVGSGTAIGLGVAVKESKGFQDVKKLILEKKEESQGNKDKPKMKYGGKVIKDPATGLYKLKK